MKNRVSLLLIALMTSVALSGACAQEPRANPTPRPEGRPGQPRQFGLGMEARLLQWVVNNPKELDLTDVQLKALKQELLDQTKERIDLNAKMETAAVNQAALLEADQPDEAALMKTVEETGRIRTEIAKLEIRHLLKVRQILTPEQRTKLREKMKEQMKTRWEGRQEGRERPMRPAAGATQPPGSPPSPAPGQAPAPAPAPAP